jgi:hypothetical protein
MDFIHASPHDACNGFLGSADQFKKKDKDTEPSHHRMQGRLSAARRKLTS